MVAVSGGGHARLEQTMAQQCLSTEQLALVSVVWTEPEFDVLNSV